MKPLKKAAETVGSGLLIVLLLMLTAVILPLMLLVFGSIYLYEKLWQRIRHDPQVKLEIKELRDEEWMEELTYENYVRAFKRVSNFIAKQAKATAEPVKVEGFNEQEDSLDDFEKGSSIMISQTLATEHATVDLRLDLLVLHNSETGHNFVAMEDDDAGCGNACPPLYVRIRKPSLHQERHLVLGNSYAAWILVSLMRGDVRFTQHGGQLWAKVPEHNVWIVQYKANKEDYGLRANFIESTARQYGRDRLTHTVS